MADLVQINNFQNKFSENLFSKDILLNTESVINFNANATSGVGFNSDYNFSEKGLALEINATQDAFNGFDITWDYQDALKHTVSWDGIYIFQFGALIISGFTPPNMIVDLEVELYINGLLSETFVKELSIADMTKERYYFFAQSFSLSTGDDIDFKFRLIRPSIGIPNPFMLLCIDGLQLTRDLTNNGFGLPTPYTLPLGNQINATYDYANSLPSQSFTGTALKINNNGSGANTNLDFKFNAIPNIFNTTTNFLEFDALELGDKVDVRADLTITTTTANQDVDIYLDVALGTASNYQIFLCRRNFKTAGTYSVNDISNWLYIGNTDTKDYNCALMFDSDANATVLNNGMVINVTKRLV